MAKRISIINFKGGVGKTTLAFHLGTGLSLLNNDRVLLVDVDHQSSLSILCLRANGWEKAVREKHSVSEIFRTFTGSETKLPGTEVIVESPMRDIDPDYNTMDILPASLDLDDIEIDLTATHQGNAIRSEWNKRTLLCRWIEETGIDSRYDYIIFDCPPATKIVSQNAIAASHGYIIPVIPEAVMERGTPHLRDMIRSGIDARLKALAPMGDQRQMYVADTELVGLAVTQIRTSGSHSGYINDHTQHLRSLQRSWGEALILPYIVHGTGVSEALAKSLPVYNFSNTQNVGNRGIHELYYELTAETARRVDSL